MAKIKTKARALLENHDALVQRRYVGDTAASDELIDLATAIEKAGLTERQATVIRMIYVDLYKREDVADMLCVSRAAISITEKAAIRRIDHIYERWEALENRTAAQKSLDVLLAMKTMKEAA